MRLPKDASWVGVAVFILAMGIGAALGAIAIVDVQPDGLAAWVQAVGSVMAILVAVAVPAVQHQRDARERRELAKERARSLSLYLLPSIRAFADANNEIWAKEHPDHDVQNLEPNACYAGAFTMNALRIPKELSDRIEQLHDLGPAAAGLTNAIYLTAEARELITRDANGSDLIISKNEFYDLMWDALGGLADSESKIRRQFPGKIKPLE